MSTLAKYFLFSYVLLTFSYAGIIPGIGVKDTKILIDNKKAIIIDVRETVEIKNGMVKGAILLPLSKMIVYCALGRRAGIVGTELEKKGYKVLNMGKFSSWKDAGLPIEIKG